MNASVECLVCDGDEGDLNHPNFDRLCRLISRSRPEQTIQLLNIITIHFGHCHRVLRRAVLGNRPYRLNHLFGRTSPGLHVIIMIGLVF